MSIKDLLLKINPFYNLILVLVIAVIFFILGRISVLEKKHIPIRIEYQDVSQSATAIKTVPFRSDRGEELVISGSGEVIGSKSGKKYYFPWCGTVKRIKPENQVKFASTEEARRAGFTPGANCKGLK